MGDLGAATDPDANSQYWNPSKYAFAYSQAAVSLNYTPWLRKLVNDIFLADHGNVERLLDEEGKPVTAHTTSPVPLIYVANNAGGAKLVDDGALCDLAPTLLELLGVTQPAEMTGRSLLQY